MHPQEIIALLRRTPFAPFGVSLTDGQTYVVRHPELAIVDRFTLHLGVPGRKGLDEPSERTLHIALLHITCVEPLDGATKQARRGAG